MIPILSNLAKNSPYPEEFQSHTQIISGRFQDWLNLGIPHWKSCFRPKNEWERYPRRWNWQKIGHFQAISTLPENFWKFPGMMKFWNSGLKIKFLDINWVGLIPCMLKSVKTSQFQGTSGTKSIDELILTWKFFFWLHIKVAYFQSF